MATPEGRSDGAVTDWNDDRGFGFITPTGGGPRAFVHISEFPSGRRPRLGSAVSFVAAKDERGRPRATQVAFAGRSSGRRANAGAVLLASLAVVVYFGVVAWFAPSHWVLLVQGALSLISFAAYGFDKSAALRAQQRTPEAVLHLWDVLGGWPGGLLARHVYRHKTRKQPFRGFFWFTVVVSCLVVGWFLAGSPLPIEAVPGG